MLGHTSWTAVPAPWQGYGPSAEWLVRRALWKVFKEPDSVSLMPAEAPELITVDLGELDAK